MLQGTQDVWRVTHPFTLSILWGVSPLSDLLPSFFLFFWAWLQCNQTEQYSAIFSNIQGNIKTHKSNNIKYLTDTKHPLPFIHGKFTTTL